MGRGGGAGQREAVLRRPGRRGRDPGDERKDVGSCRQEKGEAAVGNGEPAVNLVICRIANAVPSPEDVESDSYHY